MIIQDNTFRQIKIKHANEILTHLLELNEPFSVLCVREGINFNPLLPEKITENFTDVILFSLANYTLRSAFLENGQLIFEAGFGEENFGSVVSVPIENIIQITQEETPLFINVSATLPKTQKPKNPFAINPRNKKFLKDTK